MSLPTLVDWDQEKTLSLISKFKTYEVLWNPNLKDFHNPKKKEEAWWALAGELQLPAGVVKKKIEGLRGSYRRERSRVRSSKGSEEEYCPKWYAYKSMNFLEESKPRSMLISELCGYHEDDVSAPKSIPQPSLKDSKYLNNLKNMLPQFDHSQKKTTYCTTSSPLRPLLQNPDSIGEQHAPQIESMMGITVSDPLDSFSHSLSKDDTGLLDKVRENIEQPRVDVLPKNPVTNSTVGFNGIDKSPSKSDFASRKRVILNEKDSERKLLKRKPFKLSPRKRRFLSTIGPHEPIRPKSKSGKLREIKSMKKVTTSDPQVTANVRLSKDGTSLLDKLRENLLHPNVDGLQKTTEVNIIGFTGIGNENYDSSSKRENIAPKPAIPVEKVLESEDRNDCPPVGERHSKPLQKQEVDKADECTAFGQLVESTLRKLPGAQRIKAKMKLSQVLWDVELEALNQNLSSDSQAGTPIAESAHSVFLPLQHNSTR